MGEVFEELPELNALSFQFTPDLAYVINLNGKVGYLVLTTMLNSVNIWELDARWTNVCSKVFSFYGKLFVCSNTGELFLRCAEGNKNLELLNRRNQGH